MDQVLAGAYFKGQQRTKVSIHLAYLLIQDTLVLNVLMKFIVLNFPTGHPYSIPNLHLNCVQYLLQNRWENRQLKDLFCLTYYSEDKIEIFFLRCEPFKPIKRSILISLLICHVTYLLHLIYLLFIQFILFFITPCYNPTCEDQSHYIIIAIIKLFTFLFNSRIQLVFVAVVFFLQNICSTQKQFEQSSLDLFEV